MNVKNPSKAELFSLSMFLPLIIFVMFGFYINFSFTLYKALLVGGITLLSIGAAIAQRFARFRCMHWGINSRTISIYKGVCKRREVNVNLDKISSAELWQNHFYKLMKCSRVRLYDTGSPKPFFDMLLPQDEAAELINRTAWHFSCGESTKPQYFPSKRYSALTAAVTSREFTIMIFLAAITSLFGFNKIEYLIISAALCLFAIIYAVYFILNECRLSVCRMDFGYALQKGILGEHRIFVPQNSVIGVRELQTPLDIILKTSKVQLMCAGGRRIFCLLRYDGQNGSETAKRMLNCEGGSCTKVNDSTAIRKRGVILGIGSGAAAAVLIQISDALPKWLNLPFGCVICALVLLTAINFIMQLKCADTMGIFVTSSTVLTGCMRLLHIEHVTLHSGEIFAAETIQNRLERAYGKCRAKFLLRECRFTIKCVCLPIQRTLAILPRIMR